MTLFRNRQTGPSKAPIINGLDRGKARFLVGELHSFCTQVAQGAPAGALAEAFMSMMNSRRFNSAQVKQALPYLYPGKLESVKQWEGILAKYGLIGGNVTKIQDETQIQSSTEATKLTSLEDAHMDGLGSLYEGDTLSETSLSHLSRLIVGDRGTGITTLVKVMLYYLMVKHPQTAVRIISTEMTSFLGLERTDNLVTYVTGDMNSIIPPVSAAIADVYAIFEERVKENMDALQFSSPQPAWQPYLLIVDKWSIIHSNLKDIRYKDDRRKMRSDPLINQLKVLIQQGSKVGITVILTSNGHRNEYTGLDYTILREMSLVALGCVREGQTGGRMAMKDMITDKKILPESVQKYLLHAYREANESRVPIMAALEGTPRIAKLPDYRSIEKKELGYAGILTEKGLT